MCYELDRRDRTFSKWGEIWILNTVNLFPSSYICLSSVIKVLVKKYAAQFLGQLARQRKEKELPCFNSVLVIQVLECSPSKSIGMTYLSCDTYLFDVYIDGFAVHYKYRFCWEVDSPFPGFGIILLPEKPVKSLLVALLKQNIISGYWWKILDVDCDTDWLQERVTWLSIVFFPSERIPVPSKYFIA